MIMSDSCYEKDNSYNRMRFKNKKFCGGDRQRRRDGGKGDTFVIGSDKNY